MQMNSVIHNLATELGRMLLSRNWQVTFAESCTGGGFGYAITSVDGSSQWFDRGFVTYSNDAKKNLVGVDPSYLQQYGAVSEQIVKQMAHGALNVAQADISVGISGIAGPAGGSVEKPVGTVWLAVFTKENVKTRLCQLDGDRHLVREKAIEHALQLLIEMLNSE
jgi:nicotinamide-nucleotide amidase